MKGSEVHVIPTSERVSVHYNPDSFRVKPIARVKEVMRGLDVSDICFKQLEGESARCEHGS